MLTPPGVAGVVAARATDFGVTGVVARFCPRAEGGVLGRAKMLFLAACTGGVVNMSSASFLLAAAGTGKNRLRTPRIGDGVLIAVPAAVAVVVAVEIRDSGSRKWRDGI